MRIPEEGVKRFFPQCLQPAASRWIQLSYKIWAGASDPHTLKGRVILYFAKQPVDKRIKKIAILVLLGGYFLFKTWRTRPFRLLVASLILSALPILFVRQRKGRKCSALIKRYRIEPMEQKKIPVPIEILLQIFSYCDTQGLRKAMLVCREWHHLVINEKDLFYTAFLQDPLSQIPKANLTHLIPLVTRVSPRKALELSEKCGRSIQKKDLFAALQRSSIFLGYRGVVKEEQDVIRMINDKKKGPEEIWKAISKFPDQLSLYHLHHFWMEKRGLVDFAWLTNFLFHSNECIDLREKLIPFFYKATFLEKGKEILDAIPGENVGDYDRFAYPLMQVFPIEKASWICDFVCTDKVDDCIRQQFVRRVATSHPELATWVIQVMTDEKSLALNDFLEQTFPITSPHALAMLRGDSAKTPGAAQLIDDLINKNGEVSTLVDRIKSQTYRAKRFLIRLFFATQQEMQAKTLVSYLKGFYPDLNTIFVGQVLEEIMHYLLPAHPFDALKLIELIGPTDTQSHAQLAFIRGVSLENLQEGFRVFSEMPIAGSIRVGRNGFLLSGSPHLLKTQLEGGLPLSRKLEENNPNLLRK